MRRSLTASGMLALGFVTFLSIEYFRCTSTGRICDGYPITDAFRVQVWSISQASEPQKSISVLTEFGKNVRYLEFYHHCAQPALSSNFDKEFWSRIVLQMAHSEPAVRHALIALGYLYETETGSMKHARSKLVADEERGVLLVHYNKSIHCLVSSMARSVQNTEVALVTCVLFVCIEFMRGNYHTAFTHMTNGLKIISERQTMYEDDSQISSPESTRTADMIDQKLVPIFIRGVASALMYGVDAENVFNIPWPKPSVSSQQIFSTLQQAHEACHELRNATIVQIRIMAKKIFDLESFSNDDYQRQAELLACHHSWYQNFEAFEQQQQLSDEDRIACSALKASHYSTFVYLSCAADLRQTAYDAHLETFKKILHHAKIVVDSLPNTSSPAAHFTFDISIIPPLYFVVTRCRCPITRREAVSLQAQNPPREGLWDAEQHVVVSKRLIEMEESEVDPLTGWPVENTRLCSSVIDANMDHNGGFWVQFLYSKWVGEVGGTELHKKLIWERFVL